MSKTVPSFIYFNQRHQGNLLEIATYPDGAVRVGRIPDSVASVTARITDANGIQALFQVADILRRRAQQKYADVNANDLPRLQTAWALPPLNLYFVPYGRQDRADPHKEYNQAHSLGIFARQLNSMGWPTVTIWDPHSEVAPALITNSVVVSRENLIAGAMDHLRAAAPDAERALVVPDQGAYKATMAIAERYRIDCVCVGEKIRNMRNGEITGSFVHDVAHLKNKLVIIPDDICDGGRTFTGLAEFIRKKVEVEALILYVTHGLFSKGLGPVLDHFDEVVCPNVLNPAVEDDNNVLTRSVTTRGVTTNIYSRTANLG